ncbi:phosphotransferase family protein [Amycolatopsis acidicola]|uniref:Phosphotransferase family protein n=1 Tax=Amycolatopsis acidicola TaxID=2596893 RepID=A0A5N0UMM6_9PSEU|nr:phosphotransferase family protein [Amycolatopsis acidicola]KAA9150222.1 phosphotransferase family protein [Amycolatopsis acidicola]
MTDADLVPLEALVPWLDAKGVGSGPLGSVGFLTGGTQNVLMRFTRDGRDYVLRRPPRHKRDRSDDTMRREARVLAGLASSDVPHPELVAACTDLDVLGCVFYVMAAVDGFTATESVPDAIAADPARHRVLGESIVDALAGLGRVDPEATGLAGLGRPGGWLARQVPRWAKQLDSYAQLENWPGPELPGLTEVSDWLTANQPGSWTPGLIHGDYHFGNVLFDPETARVAAVVDWELATIGDPLLDLGHLLATWPDPAEPRTRGLAVTLDALPSKQEVVARYAAGSSRDLSAMPWYHALACYRLGILLEGTHARGCAGKADPVLGKQFHAVAQSLFEQALTVIEGATCTGM